MSKELEILKKHYGIKLGKLDWNEQEFAIPNVISNDKQSYFIKFVEKFAFNNGDEEQKCSYATLTKEEYETLKRWLEDDK